MNGESTEPAQRSPVSPQRASTSPSDRGASTKRRLSINIVANVLGFAVTTAVGIFLTPYLIRHLGVAAYGVIPLATTVSSYLTIVTLVVNAAVARFITVSLQRG